MKPGRNQLCPCGSGKKFKHCHGRLDGRPPEAEIAAAMQQHRAGERVRQAQQGLGKPIIGMKQHGHQLVAVGNTVYWSDKWKTFADFLNDYLKRKLGHEWGQEQISKPIEERHVIGQWYVELCRYQQKVIKTPGEVIESAMVGVTACWFLLAHAIYLLDHNVELQERLLRRLRDPGNFQGAYYELLVARVLIQAGFELTLEDESDPTVKHCEFAAASRETGKRYWVEAKMRAVVGLLGRTTADGTTKPNPISRMVSHLNNALAKPAADERMIFIDLNTEMPFEITDESRPAFVAQATRRLEQFEVKELPEGEKAYVFITNMTFHRDLEGPAQIAAFPFGLGMPDFNRPGEYRMSERWRQEQRHADAIRVCDSLSRTLVLPSTFDGSLPATTFKGEREPIVIGKTYRFDGIGEGDGMIGVVSSAIVDEVNKEVIISVNGLNGPSCILKEPMTDAQLADYRAHPDAYFGQVVRPQKTIKKPHELFEFFMDAFKSLPRDQLLERLKGAGMDDMSEEELLAIYAEGMVANSGMFKVVDGKIVS